MDDEPQSLKSTFALAESRRDAIENSTYGASSSYQTNLAAAIESYETCIKLIADLAIFSTNEILEDISTLYLPYLLVNYHLAELTQRISTTSPLERKRVLTTARAAYERFLHILDNYALLEPPYARLLETYNEDPKAFSTTGTGADPNARRNSKIANFKAEKELRQQLEALRANPQYLDGPGADEELVRAVHVAHLHYAVHMTFQALESLNREVEILAQAPVPLHPAESAPGLETEDGRWRRAWDARKAEESGATDRLDQPLRRLHSAIGTGGPLLTKEGVPLQPFTIVGNRAELAKGVFRPGHNLPTMSIDEYLDEERRRGGIIEGGGEASWHRPEPDEDDNEKADEATYKARAWDEFTEANAKGSGNTLNRG